MPPLPPGAKRPKDKKSFFSGIFGKRKQEPLPSTTPMATEAEPSQPFVEVTQGMKLEDIRKSLGLDVHVPESQTTPQLELGPEFEEPEIAEEKEERPQPEFSFEIPKLEEPSKIEPKKEPEGEAPPAPSFELPDLEEPSKIKPEKEEKEEAQPELSFELPELNKPSDFDEEEETLLPEEVSAEDEIIEEPPKITTEREKLLAEEEKKAEEGVKEEEKPEIEGLLPPESFDEDTEWTADLKPEKIAPIKSDFLQEVKPKIEEKEERTRPEFSFDIPKLEEPSEIEPEEEEKEEAQPEETNDLDVEFKKKEFEQKKGFSYEPGVRFADETDKENSVLIEESPQQEIGDIKKRLQASLGFGLKGEKPAKPLKEEISDADAKVRIDEIAKAQVNFPELVKELEARLADKIRAEVKDEEMGKLASLYEQQIIELDNIRAKLEKEREKLKNDRQAFEQQKIAVAGQANKTAFKEKQLRKTEEGLALLKEEFDKDKTEAEELLKKLPELRETYDNITAEIQKVSDRLKEYEGRKGQLEEIDEEIKRNEEALLEAQQRLIQTEERIKEKGFSDYLETEIKTDTLVSPKFEEKDIIHATHLELYNKIDECKSLIRERNLASAKSIYMQLREAYHSLRLAGAEKDMLYTVIREIYDDIKLAEIEGSGGSDSDNGSDNVIY